MAVAHVKVFVQIRDNLAGTTHAWTASATNANDAILVAVGLLGSSAPSAVALTATGWTFTQLGTIVGNTTVGFQALFCAIAPNTTSVTFTTTWTGGGTITFHNALGDEFSGNDITGGTTTFDANSSATSASGSPTVNVTPANTNDGLWGASNDGCTAVGSGFTKGGDDTVTDWSEWKILSGGSGVAQTVNFTGSGGYTIVAATIKAAAGSFVAEDDSFMVPRPANIEPIVSVW